MYYLARSNKENLLFGFYLPWWNSINKKILLKCITTHVWYILVYSTDATIHVPHDSVYWCKRRSGSWSRILAPQYATRLGFCKRQQNQKNFFDPTRGKYVKGMQIRKTINSTMPNKHKIQAKPLRGRIPAGSCTVPRGHKRGIVLEKKKRKSKGGRHSFAFGCTTGGRHAVFIGRLCEFDSMSNTDLHVWLQPDSC